MRPQPQPVFWVLDTVTRKNLGISWNDVKDRKLLLQSKGTHLREKCGPAHKNELPTMEYGFLIFGVFLN